jgi:hypothetical protein
MTRLPHTPPIIHPYRPRRKPDSKFSAFPRPPPLSYLPPTTNISLLNPLMSHIIDKPISATRNPRPQQWPKPINPMIPREPDNHTWPKAACRIQTASRVKYTAQLRHEQRHTDIHRLRRPRIQHQNCQNQHRRHKRLKKQPPGHRYRRIQRRRNRQRTRQNRSYKPCRSHTSNELRDDSLHHAMPVNLAGDEQSHRHLAISAKVLYHTHDTCCCGYTRRGEKVSQQQAG